MTAPVSIEALLSHRSWVRALARALTADESRADDLEQQTWLEALRRPPRHAAALRAWLGAVVKNLAWRGRRTERRRRRREEAHGTRESVLATDDAVATAELHRIVVDTLMELEEPYRSTLVLRYFQDLPPRRIAEQTGTAYETVRARLSRGREAMRKRLDRQWRGDRTAWQAALLPLLLPLLRPGRAEAAVSVGGIVAMSTKLKIAIAAVAACFTAFLLWQSAGEDQPARATLASTAPATLSEAETAPQAATTTPAATPQPGGIAIRVVSDDGPVADARLVAIRDDGARFEATGDGLVRMPAEASGKATLWASAPSYALLHVPGFDLSLPGQTVVVVRGGRLGIRFVDEHGQPIPTDAARRRFEAAGVPTTVLVVPDSALSDSMKDTVRSMFGPPESWRLADRFSWTDEGLETPLGPGPWRVFLSRPGLEPWLSPPVEVRDEAAVEVPLPRLPQRRVRLFDAETKEPLAGARVTPFLEYGGAFFPGAPVFADERGVVALPIPERGPTGERRRTAWWVETASHARELRGYELRLGDPATALDFPVRKTASLRGRAYLSSGKPAAGRTVVALQKGGQLRSTVDADGAFHIAGVALGAKRTGGVKVLMIEDWEPIRAAGKAVRIEEGKTAQVVLGEPGAGATVRGRVTCGGRPLAVFVHVSGAGSARHAQTDENGEYRFQVPPGEIQLEVMCGEPRAYDGFRITATKPISLAEGVEAVRDFDLPAGHFQVRLLDETDGKPIAQGSVMARPQDPAAATRFPGFSYRAGWAAFTSKEGEALLPGCVPQTLHTIHARASGYEAAAITDRLPGTLDQPTLITVRLRKNPRATSWQGARSADGPAGR